MNDIAAVDAVIRLSRLLERSVTELSLAHFRVLSAVDGGQQRASRLAHRLALGKPAVSASVESLCTRGLLEREAVPGDQRATALRLTAAGESALAEARTVMVARLQEVLGHCASGAATSAQLAALESGLDELAAERSAR